MSSTMDLPGNWQLESERTTHYEGMGREYTTVRYRDAETGQAVYINEVIGADDTWRYRVHHSGRDGNIGTADDLNAAKEMALAYIESEADSA